MHSEMFPLLNRDAPNTAELFQIWVNLPKRDKMAPPFFTMLWDADIPRLRETAVEVTVVAGSLGNLTPPPPPPNSWASQSEADVAIWHIRLAPGATWTMPKARFTDTGRIAYTFGGIDAQFSGELVEAGTGVVVRCDTDVDVGSTGGAEILVLQGRPIGEPVAQYGPFVMNDRAGLEKAFSDYQETQFGGWPWPNDDPVHGAAPTRFARQPNGVSIS